MGRKGVSIFNEKRDEGIFSAADLGSQWSIHDGSCFQPGGLFASVGHMEMGFGISTNPSNPREKYDAVKLPFTNLYVKYVSSPEGIRIVGVPEEEEGLVEKKKKKKPGGLRLKEKVSNPSMRRLISGVIAGAVSRTCVAPVEPIRTHLMVGSSGNSSSEVLNHIMETDGWKGLFRGNLVNVIRVAPSKARELFAYDTINRKLSPKSGEQPKLPIPASLVAGACAGVSSTLYTYALELLKTRLTIQRRSIQWSTRRILEDT